MHFHGDDHLHERLIVILTRSTSAPKGPLARPMMMAAIIVINRMAKCCTAVISLMTVIRNRPVAAGTPPQRLEDLALNNGTTVMTKIDVGGRASVIRRRSIATTKGVLAPPQRILKGIQIVTLLAIVSVDVRATGNQPQDMNLHAIASHRNVPRQSMSGALAAIQTQTEIFGTTGGLRSTKDAGRMADASPEGRTSQVGSDRGRPHRFPLTTSGFLAGRHGKAKMRMTITTESRRILTGRCAWLSFQNRLTCGRSPTHCWKSFQ
jgi:hypothetical protein